jgi:hypothetical protein
MVQGEHLRPLLGFAVVCVTAALIMSTGLGTSSLSVITAAPQVRAVPDTPDLVLGQTLDDASAPADQRATAVLASLSVPSGAEAAPSPATSSTTVHPTKSGTSTPRKPHRKSHQVHQVTPAPKPQASSSAPAPTPKPAPQLQPAPAPVHVAGHHDAVGHGVGHESRNGATHAHTHGRAPGVIATTVKHLDEHAQHHLGSGNHGDSSWHSRGHSRHDGDEGGRGSGQSGHGHDHHSGYGGRGQHR